MMMIWISRASLLLGCVSLSLVSPVVAQGPDQSPPPEASQQAKPAEVKPPASLLDVSLDGLDQNLRWAIPRPSESNRIPEPEGENVFPYFRTLSYQSTGMEIRCRDLLSGGIAKVEITVPWNARTEKVWPVLMKQLGLPVDTPRPGAGGLSTDEKIVVIPGEGKNWVVVRSAGNVTRILAGKREVYDSPETMIRDEPKDEVVKGAIRDAFQSALQN
ncbi:MAG: hypothetical protein JWO82_2270 [Akkermansiaceae bacterium]|nr:hypothetical protein [Akkermansiaceae bacterium]